MCYRTSCRGEYKDAKRDEQVTEIRSIQNEGLQVSKPCENAPKVETLDATRNTLHFGIKVFAGKIDSWKRKA
jgi:hypothetical protein